MIGERSYCGGRRCRRYPVRQVVHVCEGKRCSRTCAHGALLRALCCQKVCQGSVIATMLDDRVEWFERIDSPRLCGGAKKMVRDGWRKRLDNGISADA
jgi:hypothetical protein